HDLAAVHGLPLVAREGAVGAASHRVGAGSPAAHADVGRVHVGHEAAIAEFRWRAVPIADAPDRGGAARVSVDGDRVEDRRAAGGDVRGTGPDGEFIFINRHRVGARAHTGAVEIAIAGGGAGPVLGRRIREADGVGVIRVATV